MYTMDTEFLDHGRYLKCRVIRDGAPLSYIEVIDLWQRDAVFRAYYLTLLADAPFTAYRWETPPLTSSSGFRPFECVLFDAPQLLRSPDEQAFGDYFTQAGNKGDIVAFSNLGSDALLLAPCPRSPLNPYAHLAEFTREAPEWQNHALWVNVGQAVERRLGDSPLWLNTAGMGIPWLHVRLDSRPKYYGFAPYRAYP